MKYTTFKRIVDIIISSISLMILSPIFLLIQVAIKIDSKGPAIFKQERIGKNNKKFIIYKFRTMQEKNNQEETRITRVGKILRPFGIDEILQLINILKGEMSFIGPRPTTTIHFRYYTDKQKERHNVLPGIIGLAVVEKSDSVFDSLELDLRYANNLSLKTDLKIVFAFLKDSITIFKNRKLEEKANKERTMFLKIEKLKENFEKQNEYLSLNKEEKVLEDKTLIPSELDYKMEKLLDLLEKREEPKNTIDNSYQMQRK